MTELQQIEFNQLKTMVSETAASLKNVSTNTDRVLYALIGSDLSKDGGMIQQLTDMEHNQKAFEAKIYAEVSAVKKELHDEVKIVKEEVEKLKDIITKWKYIATGLFFSGGLIGYLLKIIFEKYIN